MAKRRYGIALATILIVLLSILWTGVRGDETTRGDSLPRICVQAPQSSRTGEDIEVLANITDEEEITSVELFFTSVKGKEIGPLSMEPLGNGTYQATIPAQEEAGILTFYIVAEDALENTNETGSITVTISTDEYPVLLPLLIAVFLIVILLIILARRKPTEEH